jgi:hypothetical protein
MLTLEYRRLSIKALLPTPTDLAPPHIILEPAPEADISSSGTVNTNTTLQPASGDANEGERALQIVYATSFVSRLVTPALADPSMWKVFHIEIRGTKLLLHKPLGDRAPGVRQLFATHLVVEDKEMIQRWLWRTRVPAQVQVGAGASREGMWGAWGGRNMRIGEEGDILVWALQVRVRRRLGRV